MICPHCNAVTLLKDSVNYCNRCGAKETDLKGVDYKVWKLPSGRIVAAPDAEAKQLEKAKKDWPSGKWC